MIKADLPRAPLILALVMAPIMESSLRQTLTVSQGSIDIFFTRPASVTLLVMLAGVAGWPLIRRLLIARSDRRITA